MSMLKETIEYKIAMHRLRQLDKQQEKAKTGTPRKTKNEKSRIQEQTVSHSQLLSAETETVVQPKEGRHVSEPSTDTKEIRREQQAEKKLGTARNSQENKALQEAPKPQYHFWESDNPVMQLLFLLGTVPPRIKGFVQEKVWNVRKKLTQNRALTATIRKKWPIPVAFGTLAVAAIVAGILMTSYSYGITVNYRGTYLGLVKDAALIEEACSDVESAISEALETEFHVNREDFKVVRKMTKETEYVEKIDLEKSLYDGLNKVSYAYTLKVDGIVIGSTIYKGALEDILSQIKNEHFTPNTISCDFKENIEITEGLLPNTKLTNLGEILEKLNSTKNGEKNYIVKEGDSWSRIAADNNMSNTELLALNPGFDSYLIHKGDVLMLSNAVPYLTVKQTELLKYTSYIPYSIQYIDDETMYEGEYEVVYPGVMGTANIEAEVTYANGEEISRNILSQDVLSRPVTEIQKKGTAPRPSWYPTGKFGWPCRGQITSYFGSRYIFGSYSQHDGLDIYVSYGTPVKASDGGVVSFSGYSGSYGYLIKIDHLNGYETYYAHNSSLLVKEGDYVYKGQTVAKVGSTGRATGPHCHFGIKYYGNFINPLSKLS